MRDQPPPNPANCRRLDSPHRPAAGARHPHGGTIAVGNDSGLCRTGPSRPRYPGPDETDHAIAQSGSRHSGRDSLSAAPLGPQREKPAADHQPDPLGRTTVSVSGACAPFARATNWGVSLTRPSFHDLVPRPQTCGHPLPAWLSSRRNDGCRCANGSYAFGSFSGSPRWVVSNRGSVS